MQQQDMEQQLWEYIDGNCDEQAKMYIAKMIEQDIQWRELYQQLLSLHVSIVENKDLEQPSMRFTQNVMEAIAQASAVGIARRYINPFVIGAMAAVFILSILSLIVYAALNADWNQSATHTRFDLTFDDRALNILAWLNIIVALLLADTLLRRKKQKA